MDGTIKVKIRGKLKGCQVLEGRLHRCEGTTVVEDHPVIAIRQQVSDAVLVGDIVVANNFIEVFGGLGDLQLMQRDLIGGG